MTRRSPHPSDSDLLALMDDFPPPDDQDKRASYWTILWQRAKEELSESETNALGLLAAAPTSVAGMFQSEFLWRRKSAE